MKKAIFGFLVAAVIVVIVAVGEFADFYYWREPANRVEAVNNPNEQGAKYLRELLSAVRQADVITITEHSHMTDYLRPDRGVDGYKEKIYAVVKISQSEKRGLIDIVSSLDPKTQDAFSACIFEPHHRLAFYRSGKLTSTMEVCFECGQIEWDGTSQRPPWAIFDGMRAYISSIGLHPKSDWWARYESQVAVLDKR